ncbi:MAG: helix-turn-helix transcriptional regulator [Bacteroidetes bacterium]|nr:helix-turn-helix transcriptional regulator [Bacteroidota bacterium]
MSTPIKETSTNQLNKKSELNKCPVTHTLDRIGGRWKTIILYHLMAGTKRYSELRRSIPPISEKMLIQQLKELEADGLVERRVHQVVPPHTDYSLSEVGVDLTPILNAMAQWGLKHGAIVAVM